MRKVLATAIAALGLAAGACASSPIPSDQLAAAQANISRAEQMGAAQNDDAAYHLRLAQQQLDEGQHLIDKKENIQAEYVLKRAAADGELAMAITQYGQTSSEAEQARARLQGLRDREAATPSQTHSTTPTTTTTPATR